jgi:hypothetical protein
VAAAKSTKSVAVLDAQIVAARCPIPRTINLNCIHCSIAPQGPNPRFKCSKLLQPPLSGVHIFPGTKRTQGNRTICAAIKFITSVNSYAEAFHNPIYNGFLPHKYPSNKDPQMNPKILFVLASALTLASSFAVPIPITAVPFAITAPGTYVLSSNLTSFASQPAITIDSPTAGQIILDLGGFTLQFNPNFGPGHSGIAIQSNSTSSNITIRNGTVQHFGVGVDVNPLATGFLSNIHINNITFTGDIPAGVQFHQVNSSSVTNCTFTQCSFYGIRDLDTQTGNQYGYDAFNGETDFHGAAFAVSFFNLNSTVTLEHAHFEVP